MTSTVRKLAVHAAALLVAAVLLTFNSAVFAAEDIPDDTRSAITAALRKRVSDLLAEKDKDGNSLKRGNYSEKYAKQADGTYLVSFQQDTIEKAEDGKTNRLKTERFRLTLNQEGSSWKVVDQKLEDSWTGVRRAWYGLGEVFRFDSLTFEKEGLKVTATNGQFYTWNADGLVWGLKLTAEDLAYTYTVPPGTDPWLPTKHEVVVKKRPDDINFKPSMLEIGCDPTTCDALLKEAFRGVVKLETAPAGGGGAKSRLAGMLGDDVRESDKNLRENPFGGFFYGYRPERRSWTFQFKRDGAKEHYFGVSWDNEEPWEVRVYASGYWQALYRYYDEATRKAGIAPYELDRREDSGSKDYEVKSVKGSVEAAVEDAERMRGNIDYVLRVKREIKTLYLIIPPKPSGFDDPNKESKRPTLAVNELRDGAGNDLTWVRLNSFVSLVYLPKPVPAGTEIQLHLEFRSDGNIRQLNPSYSEVNRGSWLPLVRFADMIDEFELTVKTPSKYQHLGVGKKTAERIDGDLRVTGWKSSSPVSFPTIIFGDYITDKSGHTATKIDKTEIPVNVWVDKVSTQALQTEKRSGTQEEFEDISRRGREGARDIRGKQLAAIGTQAAVALDLYKEVYGIDYPFDKLDLVADPQGSFYGQAPASIIYLGFGVFRGEGEMAAGMFSGGANIAKFLKDVVAHETGHQWWGSLICNANDRNYWFVESLAELSSALYVERVYGKKKYLEKVADWRKNIIDADPWSTVQNSYQIWSGEEGSPQAAIYNKGPYAFHVLRSTFGDEKFFQFLKELAQSLKGQQIVTRDMQNVMEKVYGGSMDWFFDQWIRGVGMPQYAVFYTIRQTEDGKWLVQGKIKQRVIAGVEKAELPGVYFRAVAPLTFVGVDGKKFKSAKPILVQGGETTFQMKLPQEPTEVLFNDEGEILAQDILYNRSW